jgi:tRNA G10  N-methylase Trm11
MKIFFALGNNPALSIAEIAAVLPPETEFDLIDRQILSAEAPATDPKSLIKRLGGTIKIGEILSFVPSKNPSKVKEAALSALENKLKERNETNKFCFGFSYYGPGSQDTKRMGLEMKKLLKERGVSARFVVSREKTLSSVVVEQNNLVSGGIDLVLVETSNGIVIGKTMAVQDFKGLEKRDFKRPDRDDQSGMLPPKLAQIMINLSGRIPLYCDCSIKIKEKCPILLDPFCGSGTVLQEAALMGVQKLIGSDISAKAIADTESNMKWLKENFQSLSISLQLLNLSAEKLSERIAARSIDAIVTEPYLGPQRGWHDIPDTIVELENLYSSALREFFKVLKDDGRVVMVWPVFTPVAGHGAGFLSPDVSGWKKVALIPENIKDKVRTNSRGSIIYGREGQKVWREIVVLKKS